jgi:type I restriction enzyme, S subunit
MSGELPEGWTSVELSEYVYIAGRIGWRGLKAEEYTSSGPILLSVPNLNHGDVVSFTNVNHISRVRYDESPEIQLQVGDTLLVKDGAGIGKLGFVAGLPSAATVNSSLLVVRPNDELLDPKYLFYFLKGPRLQEIALSRITGSATPHLFQKDIKKFQVLVPPVGEQRRIMENLDKLFTEVEQCKERMTKIPVLLKRFRQSVLAAACSGRLTADWRLVSIELEPGAALLERIKAKRTKMAESTKEAKQIDEAFDLESLDVDDAELGVEGIPDSWIKCRMGAIGTVVNGSTPSRKQSAYWNGIIPWVSSGEVRNNIISSTRERISKSGYDNCSVQLLPSGTVLLAMIGEGKTRGQSAILEIEATINQNIAAIVVRHGLVESEFIWRWFQFQYDKTRERGSGSGPQALNCQRVREIPFVLAPLNEQKEIIRRVNELFVFADKIETRYKTAKWHVDRLPQSILAKAFRGELVPTEAELAEREGRPYESAEQLLQRIRAAKTTTGSSGNTGRSKRRRHTK